MAPYVLDSPFWASTTVTIMNLKKWQSLPEHLKKIIEEVQIEQERAFPPLFDEEIARMRKKSIDNGAKFIKLSPEDDKWFQDLSLTASWAFDKKRYPPEIYNRFKELYGFKE